MLYAIAGIVRDNAKIIAGQQEMDNRLRTIENLLRSGSGHRTVSAHPPQEVIYKTLDEYKIGKDSVPDMVILSYIDMFWANYCISKFCDFCFFA